MNIWRITKYRCDQNGIPYGDPIQSMCYTQELMESYKNPKFVLKIEEEDYHSILPSDYIPFNKNYELWVMNYELNFLPLH